MANTRPGYKRIMGEIPEEMHEKITLYNKISDRPLNVSKAIELCMQQAVKKIDTEILNELKENDGGSGISSDIIYAAIKKDLDEGKLNTVEIWNHFKQLLKEESPLNDISMKMMLYPVDRIKHAGTDSEPCVPIVFYAQDVHCLTLIPIDSLDMCHFTKEN
jgi:hypothetical protein